MISVVAVVFAGLFCVLVASRASQSWVGHIAMTLGVALLAIDSSEGLAEGARAAFSLLLLGFVFVLVSMSLYYKSRLKKRETKERQ